MLFPERKRSQIDTETDKKQKFPDFYRFYAISVAFSTDSVKWNVEKSQQGKSSLSSRLF